MVIDFDGLARLHEHWINASGWPLEPDFPRAEYQTRIELARERMVLEGLDALAITSSRLGHWFTSRLEPHEWHDICQSRMALYVLTPDRDVLFMTPTAAGEHFNTTRRSTHVTEIRAIVERATPPRVEIWSVEQLPVVFADLGLTKARIGFELGDAMTLGMNVNDFLRLRELMPTAQLVDGSAVLRWLMSVLTPWEVDMLRTACVAGERVQARVPELLQVGMTERDLLGALAGWFASEYPEPYEYQPLGAWDVRNAREPETSNGFHATASGRAYRPGDVVMRGWSGASFHGYRADIDRVWAVGEPNAEVRDMYRMTWECNRAMAATIRPGVTGADVFAAGAAVEDRWGYPSRSTGRTGHGLRNTGSLSVHPDNQTLLERGMVISVEPMFATHHGFFDLEDQYLVTESGAECLHRAAPEEMPIVGA